MTTHNQSTQASLSNAVMALQMVWRRSHDCFCPYDELFCDRKKRRRTGKFLMTLIVCLAQFRIIYHSVHRRHVQSGIVIQRHVRGYLCRTRTHAKERKILLHIRASIQLYAALAKRFSLLQRKWRQRRLLLVALQGVVRRFLVKLHQRQEACLVLQTQARRWIAQQMYKAQRDATSMIQQHWRAVQEKRRVVAALATWNRIQACVRRRIAVQDWIQIREATICLQAWVRTCCEVAFYESARKSVIRLQAHARSRLCQRRFRQIQSSAVCLQRFVRGYHARLDWFSLRERVILCQAQVRSRQCQRQWCTSKQSIVVIESAVRRYLARKHWREDRDRIRRCQTLVRGYLARCRFVKVNRHILLLQSSVRCFLAAHSLRKKKIAVEKVQGFVRGHFERVHFVRMLQSTRKIQSFTRRCLAVCHWRQSMLAVLRIQTFYRGSSQRHVYKRQLAASIIIHNYWRWHSDKVRFDNLCQSSLSSVHTASEVMSGNFKDNQPFQNLLETQAPTSLQSCSDFASSSTIDNDSDDDLDDEIKRSDDSLMMLRNELQECRSLICGPRFEESATNNLSIEASPSTNTTASSSPSPVIDSLCGSVRSQNTKSLSCSSHASRLPRRRYKSIGKVVVSPEVEAMLHRQFSPQHINKTIKSALKIQSFVRSSRAQSVFRRQRLAATTIQAHTRRMLRRWYVSKFQTQIITIQSFLRQHRARVCRRQMYEDMLVASDGLVRHRRSSLRATAELESAENLDAFEDALVQILKKEGPCVQTPKAAKTMSKYDSPVSILDIEAELSRNAHSGNLLDGLLQENSENADEDKENFKSTDEQLHTSLIGSYMEEDSQSSDGFLSSDDNNDGCSDASLDDDASFPSIRRQLESDYPKISVLDSANEDTTELTVDMDSLQTLSEREILWTFSGAIVSWLPSRIGLAQPRLLAETFSFSFSRWIVMGFLCMLTVYSVICFISIDSPWTEVPPRTMLRSICAPVRPGTALIPNHPYIAPWWAPDDLKSISFDLLCGLRERYQIVLQETGVDVNQNQGKSRRRRRRPSLEVSILPQSEFAQKDLSRFPSSSTTSSLVLSFQGGKGHEIKSVVVDGDSFSLTLMKRHRGWLPWLTKDRDDVNQTAAPVHQERLLLPWM